MFGGLETGGPTFAPVTPHRQGHKLWPCEQVAMSTVAHSALDAKEELYEAVLGSVRHSPHVASLRS